MTLRFLTSGESHGKCLNAIIDGVPSGIKLNLDKMNLLMAKRQKGYGRGGRMAIEQDKIIINSGVRHGVTTGAPICIQIDNRDWENWRIPMATFPVDENDPNIRDLIIQKKITQVRPGHADLAGALKYNISDIRDILERSSARETATRVAVGALAMCILENFGIEIYSHTLKIGSASVKKSALSDDFNIIKDSSEKSEVRCADYSASVEMKKVIDEACQLGDTLGGLFEIVALNVPVGLGSFTHWDRRLDGLVSQAIMSIPAIKSVSIGLGEDVAVLPGSQVHDQIYPKAGSKTYSRKTNNAGGIEGGVSNGAPIVVRAAMKPIPTMKTPLASVDLSTGKEHSAHFERSDVCAVPAAGVVGEAMLAIVLADEFLKKFGGDSYQEIKSNFDNYCKLYQSR